VGVLLVLADSTASGNYTMVGNAFCGPNATPTAAPLPPTPTPPPAPPTPPSPPPPSSDTDGDTIVSYTFTFGDGSTPVTQSTPTKNTGFGSVTTSQGSCAPRPKQQTVSCSIGGMASGATVTITLVVKPTTKGSFMDTARVSATSPIDPQSANNQSIVTTQVSP